MQDAPQGMLIRGCWGDTHQCILMRMQESWLRKGMCWLNFSRDVRLHCLPHWTH